MDNRSYRNLRVLSHYSFFESTITVPSIFKHAVSEKIDFVAICDIMNLFGAIEIMNCAKQYKKKPVIGCVINTEEFGYLPVFVKDQVGYEYLCHILSQCYLRGDEKIYSHELEQNQGIICFSGMENSFITKNHGVLGKCEKLKNMFHNNFYIETRNNEFIDLTLDLANKLDLPTVLTSPVRFLKKEDVESFRVLQAIKNKIKVNQIGEEFNENFLRNTDFCPDERLVEGKINSFNIVERCHFFLEPQKSIIPKFSLGNADQELYHKTYDGLQKRLENVDKSLHETYKKRMDFELEILKNKDFADYFLITSDFVKFSIDSGIPVGPGRGSGAGSLVAYSLEITNVDPIKFGLIFERFLNPERDSMPDFDIDFCPERREEVVEYLRKKYGKDQVVNIITFGTLQPRAVLKDVARAFSIPYSIADSFAKLVPHDQINHIKLHEALEIVPKLKELKNSKEYSKLIEISLKLEGIIRNSSKHAAGIVISVGKTCPLYRDGRGDVATQFNLQNIEYIGLIKFDFLGLRTLTIIQKTLDKVYERSGVLIKSEDIPLDDKKTFDLICTADLEGVFQFESAGMRDIVTALKPDKIDDLVAINSLYRPGPMKSIPQYIEGKKDRKKVSFLHPLLKRILEPTYGVMVYQEQVMEIARICAGYSFAEADFLRRAMGKKKPAEMAKQKERFLEGAKKNNITDDIANTIFDQMAEFAGYGFNKSHSTPYAIIGYHCAYLKANYPKEFMCSIMSLELQDTEKLTKYIFNLLSMGIKLLPPCVNKGNKYFEIEDNSIRYAILAIKGVGESLAGNISKNVQEEKYNSIEDFIQRNVNYINKRSLEFLIYSGALDCFGLSRKFLSENECTNTLKGINDKEFSYLELRNLEHEAFGFYLHNPVEKIRNFLIEIGSVEMKKLKDGMETWVCGEILAVKRRRVGDKPYAFVEIADESSIVGIAVFSQLLDNSNSILIEGTLIAARVKVGKKIVASQILVLDDFLNRNHHKIYVNIEKKSHLYEMQDFIEKNPGDNEINFLVEDEVIISDKNMRDSLVFRTSFNYVLKKDL